MDGHRSRLRERFLNGGLDGFLDYEIVELLLTLGTPRKDCKPMAKAAIEHFGGLRQVLDATYDELQTINGIGPSNAFGLKLFQAVSERYAKENIPDKLDFKSIRSVAEYLQKSIGSKSKEHFVVLYLNSSSELLDIRTISIGSLDASVVEPREVFEPAIMLKAASVYISHNHPSGKTEPSREDREITSKLVESGRLLNIIVRDHIIVSTSSFFSFQEALIMD